MRLLPKVVLFLMFCLCIGSWIKFIYVSKIEEIRYEETVRKLEEYDRKKIYVDALEASSILLKMKPDNLEYHLKYADLLRKLGKERMYIEKMEELIYKFPDKKTPYLRLAQHYIQKEYYKEAINILKESKRVKDNDEINQLYQNIKGKFNEMHEYFDEIKEWHNQITFLKIENKWALLLPNNSTNRQFIYTDVGGYDLSEQVFPAKQENEWLYYDINGNRKLVPDKDYEYMGTFSEKYAPVKRSGIAGYIQRDFKEFSMKFKSTGPFKNGVAAVQEKGGKWRLINRNFSFLTKVKYDDIARDEYGFCSEYGVMFVSQNNQYILVDLKGKRIGKLSFDNVKPFGSKTYAAVSIGDKWGFINREGEWVIKPKYEKAESFTLGYAAVKQDGLWGYIESKGEFIIDPQFIEAKSFSKDGIAPVKEGEIWRMIQLCEFEK